MQLTSALVSPQLHSSTAQRHSSTAQLHSSAPQLDGCRNCLTHDLAALSTPSLISLARMSDNRRFVAEIRSRPNEDTRRFVAEIRCIHSRSPVLSAKIRARSLVTENRRFVLDRLRSSPKLLRSSARTSSLRQEDIFSLSRSDRTLCRAHFDLARLAGAS